MATNNTISPDHLIGTVFSTEDDGWSSRSCETLAPNDSASTWGRESNDDHHVSSQQIDYDPIADLDCVIKLDPINGLNHYRLILPIEKEMEAAKLQTAFGTIYYTEDHDKANSNITPAEWVPGPPHSPSKMDGFEIRSSSLGGLGAFATRDLERGDTILIEKIMFHVDNTTMMDLYGDMDKLTPEARGLFMTLHCAPQYHVDDEIAATFKTNSFRTLPNKTGICLTAARFNHACDPIYNVAYRYDKNRDFMVFTVAKPVAAGTELTITYGQTPIELLRGYGFVCQCGACNQPTKEQIEEVRRGRRAF